MKHSRIFDVPGAPASLPAKLHFLEHAGRNAGALRETTIPLNRKCGYAFALVLAITSNALLAQTNAFQRQVITFPANPSTVRFVDLGHDGRPDLLAVDPLAKRLLIYRQRASGFTNAPDQVIALPPHTSWIAPCDVEAHPGLELLASTARGLLYYRQTGGEFEPEPRALIKADQVFTNDDSPRLITLASNKPIPMISATQAVLYRRNEAYEWDQGQPVALAEKHSKWFAERNEWTMGPNSSRTLWVQTAIRAHRDEADNQKPENDAIKKLIEEMAKATPRQLRGTNRVDIDGDGRKDFILWQTFVGLDPRTDIYVFLRGSNGLLPEQPTQIVHGRGFPIPIGSTVEPAPVADLKSDGSCELVLMQPKTAFTSASSIVDMVLSGGMEFELTIRSFNGGAFAGTPNAIIPITTILPITSVAPAEEMIHWPFFICGDFNGDGRPDLVVRHSATQWSISFSTNDGHWFAPQPAMAFDTPVQEFLDLSDLNGDGRADIVLREESDPRIFIFLSKSKP